ncbi:MAG: DUF1963 domain-containing protein [Lachnospiraceae bacterium]|nr:DUF1963 domain-containing protein [Lachnospiraceae bacterium]
MDLEKVFAKVNDTLTPQPAVRFSIERGELGIFDSKIGGVPYFPKDMEYPYGKSNSFQGQPLSLLAQLNFERLPHIPDFPTKGILQFFIAADDLYGMTPKYGDPRTRQENFRVIYHENIITDESKLLSADEIPKYTGSEECYLPFRGAYKLIAHEPEMMPVTTADFRFNEEFVKYYNELADEPIDDFWDLEGELCDKFDKLCELMYRDIPDAVIGGYPVFTQWDPRIDDYLAECDVLLFELESVYKTDIDIRWGDMGTGSFLIPRDNLKARDFSKVLYNYDCH